MSVACHQPLAPAAAPPAAKVALAPWLEAEPETAAVAHGATHPEVAAVELYGSIARNNAWPLDDPERCMDQDDPEPRDVELLTLVHVPDGREELRKQRKQTPKDMRHRLWQAEWDVIFADGGWDRDGTQAGAEEDAVTTGTTANTGAGECDLQLLASPWELAKQ